MILLKKLVFTKLNKMFNLGIHLYEHYHILNLISDNIQDLNVSREIAKMCLKKLLIIQILMN